jgi:hypothetical protein
MVRASTTSNSAMSIGISAASTPNLLFSRSDWSCLCQKVQSLLSREDPDHMMGPMIAGQSPPNCECHYHDLDKADGA